MKKIVLTGGGTAGHVTPNLALLPYLRQEGWEVIYIGSEDGMEKKLVTAEGVPYYGIPTGKLRRYLSKQNIKDAFRVAKGVKAAKKLLKELKPDLVFSKGGFVAVPVVLGAKANRIPVIIHESDITPGLANKIAIPWAKTVCTTFPETLPFISGKKGVHTGSPIRRELFQGERNKGLAICGFEGKKPVLMMMGGSSGSVKLNTCLREVLPSLLTEFDIIHLCGEKNIEPSLLAQKGYFQLGYATKELPDLLAAADCVISRAGSNAICEFLALQKPQLLIPLSKKASRGDQILNAASFMQQGFSLVLTEEELTGDALLQNVRELYKNRQRYIDSMKKSGLANGTEQVMAQIRSHAPKEGAAGR